MTNDNIPADRSELSASAVGYVYARLEPILSASELGRSNRKIQETGVCCGEVFWVETRPDQKGRSVLMACQPGGVPYPVSLSDHNVRTRVHGYGGGAWTASPSGDVFWVDDRSRVLFWRRPGERAAPLIELGSRLVADLFFCPVQRSLLMVAEDEVQGQRFPVNSVVRLSVDHPSRGFETLLSGRDFYSNPTVSPDGRKVSWLCWDLPGMPWGGTELWCAPCVPTGVDMRDAVKVTGGREEQVFQPTWGVDGRLYHVSDAYGWANLWVWDGQEHRCLIERRAEMGLPQWVFGMKTFGVSDKGFVIIAFFEYDRWHLGRLNLTDESFEILDCPYTHIDSVSVDGWHLVFLGADPGTFKKWICWDLSNEGQYLLETESVGTVISKFSIGTVSRMKADHFSGEIPFIFYPPCNERTPGRSDGPPPAIVVCHGGPTSCSENYLDLKVQFWTQRGFALVDVNYGGSTGYGRAYRERIRNNWGIVDVEDTIAVVDHLRSRGLIAEKAVFLKGSSAGGFTALNALIQRDDFLGATVYYGVADLAALSASTHKFESGYEYYLLGPDEDLLKNIRRRSPIHYVSSIRNPVLFFQGLDDDVVPAEQTRRMEADLLKQGVPVEAHYFPGEGHGFRMAETVEQCMAIEWAFYQRLLNEAGL